MTTDIHFFFLFGMIGFIQILQLIFTFCVWKVLARKYDEINNMYKAVLEDNDDLHTLLEELENKNENH